MIEGLKTLIEDFHNSLPSDNIDSIETKLTNILNSVGKISLRRKKTDFTQKSLKRFTSKTKRKCEIWFDKECNQIKSDINSLSNQNSKSPLDNELKEKFKLKMKEFKTICQKKRNIFWNEKMKNLESNFSNKSHSFWNSWKEFSETNNKQYVDIQDGNKWENFYKNLLSNKMDKSVPPTQPSPLNLDLNKPFTLSELKQVIKKLKKKKGIGFDRISNEMIQNAPQVYIDLILKMFNKILILGHVPKEWSCGLITPIYKKGSKLDPDNYWGICVMNALLRSFMFDNESETTSFSYKK